MGNASIDTKSELLSMESLEQAAGCLRTVAAKDALFITKYPNTDSVQSWTVLKTVSVSKRPNFSY